MKGIHGNSECERCGACCIYFSILEDDTLTDEPVITGRLPQRFFKESGEVCKYLKFDDLTKTTSCSNYRNRPKMCHQFACYSGSIENMKNPEIHRRSLKEIADEVFV